MLTLLPVWHKCYAFSTARQSLPELNAWNDSICRAACWGQLQNPDKRLVFKISASSTSDFILQAHCTICNRWWPFGARCLKGTFREGEVCIDPCRTIRMHLSMSGMLAVSQVCLQSTAQSNVKCNYIFLICKKEIFALVAIGCAIHFNRMP